MMSVHSVSHAAKQARKALLRAKGSMSSAISVYEAEKEGDEGSKMPPFDAERFSWMIQSGDEMGLRRYFEHLMLSMSDPGLAAVEIKLTYYAVLNVLKINWRRSIKISIFRNMIRMTALKGMSEL